MEEVWEAHCCLGGPRALGFPSFRAVASFRGEADFLGSAHFLALAEACFRVEADFLGAAHFLALAMACLLEASDLVLVQVLARAWVAVLNCLAVALASLLVLEYCSEAACLTQVYDLEVVN